MHTTSNSGSIDLNSFDSTVVEPKINTGRNRFLIAAGITGGVLLALAVSGVLLYRYYFHAHINPTVLSDKEKVVLNEKLERIQTASNAAHIPLDPSTSTELNEVKLLPPVDQELLQRQQDEFLRQQEMERRTLTLSSRELNAMLNYQTDFGQTFRIDFKPGYLDIQCVIPVPEDVAVLGGKTLRGSVDVGISKLPEGKLALIVRDVTVCGLPMPNAWLGNIKNQNLIEQFGSENEILKIFADGIEHIEIVDGQMRVRLAE